MPAVWVPGRLDAACLGATSESLLYEVFGLSKHFFKFLKIQFFYSPITFPTLLYHEVVGLTKHFSFKYLKFKKNEILRLGRYINIRYISMYRID